MIEDKTKVNENVEFDDGKELTDHLVPQESREGAAWNIYVAFEFNGEETDKFLGITLGKLSPNPDGSGYLKQIVVNEGDVILDPEENVLYIYQDKKYKWLAKPIVEPGTNNILVPAGWVRVDNLPNLYVKDGGRGTPVKENQPPRKRPHVFNEPVAFQDDVYIKGEKISAKAYNHNIFGGEVGVHIVLSDDTPFTLASFTEFVYKKGFRSSSNYLQGYGINIIKVNTSIVSIYEKCGFYSEDGETLKSYGLLSSISLSVSTQSIQTQQGNRQVVTAASLNITTEQASINTISSLTDIVS